MSETLHPSDFRELPGPLATEVNVGGSVRHVELAVRSVQPLPPHRFRDDPFSVILAGPPEPLLPQATYRVRHPVLGEVDLFLVPIARSASAAEYEATFN